MEVFEAFTNKHFFQSQDVLAEQENTPDEEPKRENNTTAPIEQVSTIIQTRGQV